ncbi:MAG: hypothetical protein QXL24_06125, partial [Candidatus Jordarchaeaceae archaeon]
MSSAICFASAMGWLPNPVEAKLITCTSFYTWIYVTKALLLNITPRFSPKKRTPLFYLALSLVIALG